jgi:hypothetical protein
MIGNFQTSKSFKIREREYRCLWPIIKIACKPIICCDRALVLQKKNLPGRGLTKFEKHCCSVYHPDSDMGRDETVSHTAGGAQWSCYCLLAGPLRLHWKAAVCLPTVRDQHRLGVLFCDFGGSLFGKWEAIAANWLTQTIAEGVTYRVTQGLRLCCDLSPL